MRPNPSKVIVYATILFISLITFRNSEYAYANDSDDKNNLLSASIGGADTDGGDGEVQAEITYDLGFEESFNSSYTPANEKGWLTDFTPDIKMKIGEGNSFSSIIGKISGNYIRFHTKTVSGVHTPDSSRLFHAFPVSIGFETDQDFDTVNAIAEVGYVPFALSPFDIGIGNTKVKLGVNPRFGVFFQGGYKAEIDDETSDVGGRADESSEEADSGLLRIKSSANLTLPILSFGSDSENNVSIILDASVWYDIANDEFYDKESLITRFSVDQGKAFDLRYENGSGAPNFNEGEQFGAYFSIFF